MKGGKREGAGRRVSTYGKTTTIRVPIACVEQIKNLVADYKKKVKK